MEVNFKNRDETAYSKNEGILMHPMKNLLFAFFIFLTTDAAFAASAPITCGSTLTKTTYTLPADLDCSKATAAITVRQRAVLNLNNHVYAGQIVLDGSRAQLRNGTIDCSYQEDMDAEIRCGIEVQGTGRHTVQNVLILNPAADSGIDVMSDNNSLISNTVFSSGSLPAVFVGGNNNSLEHNRAILSSTGGGFWIAGNRNQLTGNYATLHHFGYLTEGDDNVLVQNVYAGVPDEFVATDEGFGIGGSRNRLTRNVVMNEDFGIFVFSEFNIIQNNIAIRNGVDLLDVNTNCQSTIWQNNIFQTSNQPCIGGATIPFVQTKALEQFSALRHHVHSRRELRVR